MNPQGTLCRQTQNPLYTLTPSGGDPFILNVITDPGSEYHDCHIWDVRMLSESSGLPMGGGIYNDLHNN